MSETEGGSGRGFGMRGTGQSSGSSGNGGDAEAPEEQEAVLSDDDTVDVGEEEASVHTKEVLDRLDRELVGLEPVKARIREIGDLLLVDRLRRKFGISSTRPSLHMSFTGSPGTGKTTVALRMAELLHRLGYLRKGHLVAVTRDDLVGQYIGHTAPKTKEVLKRAMGGVLFIDEAYYLYRQENERDYGQETIEILLQIMEQERENVVVILAGYKDRMDQFFQSNPGMGSRIAHHIHFPDYELDELVAIGGLMLAEQQYELSEEAQEAFRGYLERRMEQPRFANARSVRNALERARLRQATRIISQGGTLSRKDLTVIEAEDILKSRVFSDTEHDNPDGVRDTEGSRSGDPDEAPAGGRDGSADADVDAGSEEDEASADGSDDDVTAAPTDEGTSADNDESGSGDRDGQPTSSTDGAAPGSDEGSDEPGPGTVEYGLDLDSDDTPPGGPESQAAAGA